MKRGRISSSQSVKPYTIYSSSRGKGVPLVEDLKLWGIFTVSVYAIGLSVVFFIVEKSPKIPKSRQIAEAAFFNFSITLFIPILFCTFTKTSMLTYFGLSLGMFLGFTLCRYYVNLTALPPSPKYLWNAEKVLWKYISRMASR